MLVGRAVIKHLPAALEGWVRFQTSLYALYRSLNAINGTTKSCPFRVSTAIDLKNITAKNK